MSDPKDRQYKQSGMATTPPSRATGSAKEQEPSSRPTGVLARVRKPGRRSPAARRLSELAAEIGARASSDTEIQGIALDSRKVEPGDLFVAVAGSTADGRAFVDDARARGAVAVVAQEPVPVAPTLVVDDPRAAAAHLAAALYDHPAERIRLIGVSGTLGKTSTTFLLRDIMAAAGEDLGLIGSLGIRYGETILDTGMTTPDAPVLQEALSTMADRGVRSAAMEVTSHALVQNRLEGLSFKIGLLTNLVPDEHLEFHATPEDYLRAKVRYFDLLEPGAPLIVNADDPLAHAHTRALDRPIVDVSASGHGDAAVRVENLALDPRGSHFRLRIVRALPSVAGNPVEPTAIPIALPVLGTQQAMNFALAATLALMTGIGPDAIVRGARRSRAIRRRMEIVREQDPTILDDTVGHPRSLRAVFETVALMNPRGRVHVIFGMRGMRGPAINRSLGETLAELAHGTAGTLVVTSSEDTAGPRDCVQPNERAAFLDGLSRSGATEFCYEPNLERAIGRVFGDVRSGDFVLLLGAQGMDRAADILRTRLDTPRT